MKCYVAKVIRKAKAQEGYLEKKSPYWLNNKTKNVGDNNYTKYGKWFGANGVYWCAIFISWIFAKAYGLKNAKELLCGGISASCENIRQQFIGKGQYHADSPGKGDIVFFSGTRHSGANHIGLIYKVTASYIYTVEGNTSGASELEDNGGGVAKKSYPIGYGKILGYGSPKYDVDTVKLRAAKPVLRQGMTGSEVRILQRNLNKIMDAGLVVDGDYGSKTALWNEKYKQKYCIKNTNGTIYGRAAYRKMVKLLK